MNENYKILELDKIIEMLKSYSRLPFPNEKLENVEPLFEYDVIKYELERVEEAISVVTKVGQCNFDFVHDISLAISKAYKGGILNEEQLYRISSQYKAIDNTLIYYNAIRKYPEMYPNFQLILNSFHLLKDLSYSIDKVVSFDFTIYDNASPELAKIRKDIINKNNELRKRLASLTKNNAEYLMDNIVTIRNDRYVIPVKNAFKNSVKGIIHDQSSSNQTVFIEPEEIVAINNEIASLKIQEKEEIERLLKYLSGLVAKNYNELKINLANFIELDFLLAKGAFGLSYDGITATLVKDQKIDLKGARHPLIDKNKVVANDFILDQNKEQVYLITGPNTGGKTVSLKTVGLLTLMNQSCLAIPTNQKSILGIFEKVLVDIGDNQNIAESLSTFSSHISKLVSFASEANSKSLILVDELGGGTDPSEGEALAMSLIEYFHNKNSLLMATTHYQNLKNFALEQEYIVSASMAFDQKSLKPTYKLLKGVMGKSYAFEIASSLNLSKEIISQAQFYKDKYSTQTTKAMEKLEYSILENESLRRELDEKEKILDHKLKEAEILRKNINDQKEKIREEANLEVEKLVNVYKEKLDNIMKEVRENENIKMHNIIEAKTKIKETFSNDEQVDLPIYNHEFSINDYCKVSGIDRTGIIKSIEGENATVLVNNMMLKVKLTDLTYVTISPKENLKVKKEAKLLNAPTEINLLGYTVEEAKTAIDKFLDNALRVNHPFVRIIHGYGTGKLKKGIWEYLKTKKFIKEFHYAGEFDGGMGATIVVLKAK